MSQEVAAGSVAVSSSGKVTSWHNAAALWLVVGLATWFQSERAAVSLTPLLLVTALVAIDAALAFRAGFASTVVDLTMDDTGENTSVIVHFDRPPGGQVSNPLVLSDLVVVPTRSVTPRVFAPNTVAIPVDVGVTVLGVEFVMVSSGLGLIRSSRSHTVFASSPLHSTGGAVAENERRMPVDESLRSYQFGDSMRSVHWPSTARTGTLLVRAANHAIAAPVVVVVERAVSNDPSLWDGVVNEATSVVTAALSQQRPVVLVCRSVSTTVDSPLLAALTESDATSVAGNLGLLVRLATVDEYPIEHIATLRAKLAAVVPGPVPFEDENSVRLS